MKLRAIIPNEPGHASNWWRIIRPFEMLRRRGHDASWYAHDDIVSIDVRDAVVILHRIIPANPEQYIQRLYREGAKSVVYSMDDLTTDAFALREYLVGCGGLTTLAIDRIIDRIPNQLETISRCNGVIVTTWELFDEANLNVCPYVLYNAIDEEWYIDALSSTPDYIGTSDKCYIGYASGRRPESDLDSMAKAWGRISREYENVRFVVAGWQPDIIDRNIDLDRKIRIPFVPLDQWPKSMQVDIGCCPLADTNFNRGKSPIKWMEYTMAGAAVVASPLVYDKEITSSVTGFIAHNEDEWYQMLGGLIEGSYRKRIQENAQYVMHNYKSLQATISDWEYVLGMM